MGGALSDRGGALGEGGRSIYVLQPTYSSCGAAPSALQYVFHTCVNKASDRTLHDELAKQLALYFKQQDSGSISVLLDVRKGGGVGALINQLHPPVCTMDVLIEVFLDEQNTTVDSKMFRSKGLYQLLVTRPSYSALF